MYLNFGIWITQPSSQLLTFSIDSGSTLVYTSTYSTPTPTLLSTTNSPQSTQYAGAAKFGASSGVYLLLPDTNQIQEFIVGNPATYGTLLTTPFSNKPLLITNNGTNITVAGRNYNTLSYSTSGILFINSQLLVTDPATNELIILDKNSDGSWSSPISIATSGVPSYISGTVSYAAVSENNNIVEIFTDSAGVWSSGVQQLNVDAPSRLSLAPNNDTLLITQPSLNQLTEVHNTAGVFSVNNTISIDTPVDVAIASSTRAYAAGSSGLSVLAYTTQWGITETVSVTGTITRVQADPLNAFRAFTTASSGTSGYVFSIYNGAVESTYSFAGSADDLQCASGVCFVLDKTNNAIHSVTHNNTTSSFTQATSSIIDATDGIYFWDGYIWAMQPSQIQNFRQIDNVDIAPDYIFGVATYDGSTWSSIGSTGTRRITAITGDTSGNTFLTTQDNYFYKFDSSAAIVSGYPEAITFTKQLAGTTLGISSLYWDGINVYGAMSLYGGILQITPS